MIFVSPEFPGRPTSGGVLRISFLLRSLARHFDIHCVTFLEKGRTLACPQALKSAVTELTVLPLEPHREKTFSRYARNLKRALHFVPPLVDRFGEPEARHRLQALLAAGADWVWLEHLWLAPYVDCIAAGSISVLDAHNVESDFYRQLRQAAPNPLARWGSAIFERAARRVEKRYLPHFDHVVAVSEEDRKLLGRHCPPEKITVLPNAVRQDPLPPEQTASDPWLYFAGRLDYLPNQQAVHWFHQKVWPAVRQRLPQTKWRILGARPEFLGEALLRDPNIETLGEVEHAEPYFQPSSLVIVPLSLGGGTRFKILEAWAAGKPVVSTTKGAEGLAAAHGENIWLADRPEEFAEAVINLLSKREVSARLGQRGWETVRDHYSWERGEQQIAALLRCT
jgi:glycosyltransferase involved in cell wall biosynthesis